MLSCGFGDAMTGSGQASPRRTSPGSERNGEYAEQLRILLLVSAVSAIPGNGRKLDGLTKMAKLDFLVRHPDYEEVVATGLREPNGGGMKHDDKALVTSRPMIRYRYGPWDNGYYSVLGALFGRDLLRYTRGKQGSVAIRLTENGKALAQRVASDADWEPVVARIAEVSHRYGTYTGNQLKDAIYMMLPEAMDKPYRTEL
jgi:hypothetical protein